MSIEYKLRLMPAKAFATGEPERWNDEVQSSEPCFIIHKGADFGLHQAFVQLGGPLRFAIAGDHCPHGNYEDPQGPDPVFGAYVTPATVLEVATALAKVPRWRIIELLRALDRSLVQHKPGRDLYSGAYDTVQAAYAAAARQGAGLSILIS